MENIAALLRCIPAFISVLVEFDLNSLIVLDFPEILLEICTWPTTHQLVGERGRCHGHGEGLEWLGDMEHAVGTGRLSGMVSGSHEPKQDGSSESLNATPRTLEVNA